MIIKSLRILLVLTIWFGITSCSKDDNEYHGDGAIGNVNSVFPNGMVKSIFFPTYPYISNITYDEQGRVTSMNIYGSGEKIDIQYTTANTVTVITYNYGMDSHDYTIPIENTFILGANGFIKSGFMRDDYVERTWKMGYDKHGHLTSLICTIKRNQQIYVDTTTLIYNENGDLIREKYESKSEDSIFRISSITKFSYTSANVPQLIENKGNIMLFQNSYIGDKQFLYYAGLLGKSTTHLPVALKSTATFYYSPEYEVAATNNKTMTWKLDKDRYPLYMIAKDSVGSIRYDFRW